MVNLQISERNRHIILLLSFFLVLRVLTCSIVPESSKKAEERCQPMSINKEVSSAEVEQFLKLWSEYVEKGYDKEVSDKISLMDGKLEDNLPISIKMWFNAKCWTADRFYYIEDRLRSAIQTLYLKRHSAGIISILNERINDNNYEEYQNMIEQQNKIANIENISDAELKYVEMREAEIVNILNM